MSDTPRRQLTPEDVANMPVTLKVLGLRPRVHACLFRGSDTVCYLPVRAVEGVIAVGRRVEVQIGAAWKPAHVVESWPHGFGSVVCLEIAEDRDGRVQA